MSVPLTYHGGLLRWSHFLPSNIYLVSPPTVWPSTKWHTLKKRSKFNQAETRRSTSCIVYYRSPSWESKHAKGRLNRQSFVDDKVSTKLDCRTAWQEALQLLSSVGTSKDWLSSVISHSFKINIYQCIWMQLVWNVFFLGGRFGQGTTGNMSFPPEMQPGLVPTGK